MKIEEFCERLRKELVGLSGKERLERAADALGRAFRLRPDEVGIFKMDAEAQALGFLWPPKLKSAGSIPLTSDRSLAARTARDRQGTLNNTFVSTPHAFVFEAIPLSQEKMEGQIQKIMSVPLLKGDDVVGVLQVSRKGASVNSAGADFSQQELAALQQIAAVVAEIV